MRFKLFLLTAFAALLVAGCGGSSDSALSASEFADQANTICVDGEAAIKDVATRDEFATVIEPFIQKIEDLEAPDDLKSAQEDFVSLSREQVAATKAGDDAKAKELSVESDKAGVAMGADQCANNN